MVISLTFQKLPPFFISMPPITIFLYKSILLDARRIPAKFHKDRLCRFVVKHDWSFFFTLEQFPWQRPPFWIFFLHLSATIQWSFIKLGYVVIEWKMFLTKNHFPIDFYSKPHPHLGPSTSVMWAPFFKRKVDCTSRDIDLTLYQVWGNSLL